MSEQITKQQQAASARVLVDDAMSNLENQGPASAPLIAEAAELAFNVAGAPLVAAMLNAKRHLAEYHAMGREIGGPDVGQIIHHHPQIDQAFEKGLAAIKQAFCESFGERVAKARGEARRADHGG
jgi:hypothetical protein